MAETNEMNAAFEKVKLDDEKKDITNSLQHFNITKTYSILNVYEEILKDEVRNLAYRRAIHGNKFYFNGKIVLDVGCGTGILSLFAAKAGASKVIAVEDSDMADIAIKIVNKNKLADVIKIVKAKVENVILPDNIKQVDIIISDWMGHSLVHGNKMKNVLFARDTWLKPNGLIFPDKFSLHLTAVECRNTKFYKIDWLNKVENFDFGPVRELAMIEPIVEAINSKEIVTHSSLLKTINIYTASYDDLEMNCPFDMKAYRSGDVHALITHFDVEFSKSRIFVGFSTSPRCRPTHWKQTIFCLKDIIKINRGEVVSGNFKLKPSATFDHINIEIDLHFIGTQCQIHENGKYIMR